MGELINANIKKITNYEFILMNNRYIDVTMYVPYLILHVSSW